MAFVAAGSLLTGVTTVFSNVAGRTACPCIFDQVRHYPARVGTRARKLKLAKQAKLVKTRKLMKMMEQRKQKEIKKHIPLDKIRMDDVLKGESPDNVWTFKVFQWPVYSMNDAVQAFREVFHPTMYNMNPSVSAFIELNMTSDRKGKFIKGFSNVRLLPNPIPVKKDRKIIAFTSNSSLFNDCTAAGATVVGGKDLIKEIQIGDVSAKDFDYYLANTDIVGDLGMIRGILGANIPSFKRDTLGADIVTLIKKYKIGLLYSVKSHEIYPQYATATATIGTLDMDAEDLLENLCALIDDICKKKAKHRENFVTRIQLQCLPSRESFKLDSKLYLPEETPIKVIADSRENDEEDDGPEPSSVVISNV